VTTIGLLADRAASATAAEPMVDTFDSASRDERAAGVEPAPPRPSPRVWLEVADARAAGVTTLDEPRELRTGWLVEVADPWGNLVGLTDYVNAPKRARSARR